MIPQTPNGAPTAPGRVERARWPALVLLFALVAAVALLAANSYRLVDRELTQAAMARRSSLAFLAATVLTEKLDRLIDIAISLSTRARFRQLVEQGRWPEAGAILKGVPDDFPYIDRLVLVDSRGTLRADVPSVPAVHGRSFAYRDWFQGVTRDWRPYISRIYRRGAAPQRNVFAAAVPIKSVEGIPLGVVAAQVRSDQFFEWTKDIDVGTGGVVYVVDKRGTLVAHPNFAPQGELIDFSAVPIVQNVLGGARGVEIEQGSDESQAQVVAYEPIRKHGWGVVLVQPTAAAFSTRDDQLRRILVAYALNGATLALAALLAVLIVVQRRRVVSEKRARAELERNVAERTAELRASNQELESFSYSVSHDLRAPLRAIDGFAEMVQEAYGEKLDDEGRRKLWVIRENTQRMGELIEDLLTFSRLGRQPVLASGVDMAAMAKEVFEDLRAVSPGSPVRFAIKPMPPAWCDRTLVRQVWVNLLANALKFSASKESPEIEAGGYVEGEEHVYYVKDSGVGFDMRFYPKLFGVFERLHNASEFPGTGVGLAIVQRVTTRHGGRVWAESQLGEGASFYFSLPRGNSQDEGGIS